MAQVRTSHVERVLTVDLAPGEEVLATLVRVAGDAGVRAATVSLSGTLGAARLILGRRRYSRATHDPDRVSFDDPREVVGTGELRERAPGVPELVLRCVIGREREVFVADVVEATVAAGARATLTELRAQEPAGS